jgi:enterochelin esterase-like enzyme
MLGPTSWWFLGVLVVAFAGLLYLITRTRRLALRVVAGVLAFGLSTLFGAGLVNKNYAYYTTWGAIYSDFNGSGVVSYQNAMAGTRPDTNGADHDHSSDSGDREPLVSAPPSPTLSPTTPSDGATAPIITIDRLSLAASPTTGSGRVVRLTLPGARSGISRVGYVYLPPQYFKPAFVNTRFPVVELLHGDPGMASGWIYALHVPEVMDHEIDSGKIGPMIIVMPSTYIGKHGQDCVDAPHGDLDDTYLTSDVSTDVVASFRALPLGLHWGIGGLSDGGFCAANLALRHPGDYGAAASMDGFFSPQADLKVLSKVLGTDPLSLRANDPTSLVLDASRQLPRFWIMSGTGNSVDTLAARYFREAVTTREPHYELTVAKGTHTTPAWRAALPNLLEWSWNTLSGGHVGVGTEEITLRDQPLPALLPSAGPSSAGSRT